MRLGDAFRFNAKACGSCGVRFSVFAKFVGRLSGPISFEQGLKVEYAWEATDGKIYQSHFHELGFTCSCGKARVAHRVLGKYNAGKKCDGRCLAATGFQCECACKGKNHGAGHELRANG